MNKPLISIASAFYNEELLLPDMLKSVFAQTFTDWELILLDDGSTDNSLEIAKSIDDPRVRVFSNGKNLGRSASLNKLTALARGKYIARMDADDMCSRERIEKQVKLIESDPELDVVGTGICYLDKFDNPIGHSFAETRHSEICKSPARNIGLCHGSILGKKEWFQKNLYNEKISYAIDYCLFTRTYRCNIFGNVAEPLYYYKLENSYNLKKQFKARQISAKFLFKHYIAKPDYFRAIACYIQQYVKYAVTLGICLLGMQNKLLSRRFSALSQADYDKYSSEIAVILNLSLPLKSKTK